MRIVSEECFETVLAIKSFKVDDNKLRFSCIRVRVFMHSDKMK